MLNEVNWFSNNESKKFAEKVLSETDQKRDEAIAEIKEWLSENEKIRAKDDDQSILAFLRGCKFNIEKTKTKIRNFYMMKTERPEWFSNRNPALPIIQELLNLGVFIPLKKHHDNQLVCIIRTAAHDPKMHKQDDVFKVGKMLLDIAIKDNFENATVYGISAIFDMSNVTAWHAQQLPPHVIKKAVFAWQNYSSRPKQLEFINAPFYINVVLNIFKSFMSAKLKQRIRVHFSGTDSLHQVFDKNILPIEYGGSEETIQDLIDYWRQRLSDNTDWFKEDENYKSALTII